MKKPIKKLLKAVVKVSSAFQKNECCADKRSNEKTNNTSISHEAIYNYILKNKKKDGDLYKNLRQQNKKRNKCGSKKVGRALISNKYVLCGYLVCNSYNTYSLIYKRVFRFNIPAIPLYL